MLDANTNQTKKRNHVKITDNFSKKKMNRHKPEITYFYLDFAQVEQVPNIIIYKWNIDRWQTIVSLPPEAWVEYAINNKKNCDYKSSVGFVLAQGQIG